MGKIWITSDTHFGHDREFIWGPRGYANSAEKDADIIKKWNEVVSPEDTVYHLGDVMLGDNENGMNCIKQLNGNIHIIRGNHDTDTRWELYDSFPNVTLEGWATMIKYKKMNYYLSHFPTLTANLDDGAPIKARVINLCGHSHIKNRFKDMDKGLIYHVEIDCHNNFPISFDEILFDINHFISMGKSDQIDIIKKDIY